MFKYKLILGGINPVKFTEMLVDFASKGAKPVERAFPKLTIPYRVEMLIDSEELIESVPECTIIPIPTKYTREELDNLDWETLKRVCKHIGLTGRDREQLTRKYIQQTQ